MKRRVLHIIGGAVALATASCGGTPGARPHDMSEAQHEAAARQNEQSSAAHGAQYDLKAITDVGDCVQYLGSCWGSNPTDEHKKQAAALVKSAADHRMAAKALRDVEARSCLGVSAQDRDVSPFFHREAIVSISPLLRAKPEIYSDLDNGASLVGATIVMLPASGLTLERLQHVIDCHIARNSSLGHDVPEMAYCPLVPKDVTAKVSSTGNGFAIDIASKDGDAAAEVLRRAKGLARP